MPGEEETVREERDNPPTHAGEEGRRSRPLSQELAGVARWGFRAKMAGFPLPS
ncbi:hypothetical protein SRABI106_00286 [Rahnella aquatilis]|nr:hypothetical protein SRABI106_00286 [Rahnella aquatilis]